MSNHETSNSAWERIDIREGDLTEIACDAIVNAANSSLLGGGGVDGAIHRAAGLELLAECRALGGCPTGEARITRGYELPAKFVIHTVGPVYCDGRQGEPELLQSCYRNSLELAVRHRAKTIAFPAISCGVYGYPLTDAAEIALSTTGEFLDTEPRIKQVIFVLFLPDVRRAYENALAKLKARK